MNFLNSLAPYAHWLVRLSLAGTFIYHGVSKFPPTAFIEFSGLPLIVGWAVAIGEVSAGACLIVGAVTKDLITRLGGLGVVIIMAGAIPMAHLGKGWGGMEFQVLMLATGVYFLLKGNNA